MTTPASSIEPLDPAHPPIGYHGIIGDMHTACLVGKDTSIDWYCYPHFDDPPIFCGILDGEKGGRFRIGTDQGQDTRQLYLPNTNVLITRHLSPTGLLEVTDLMPVQEETVGEETDHWHGLIRRVRATRGRVEASVECLPTFDFARQAPKVTLTEDGARLEGPNRSLRLVSPVDLEAVNGPPGTAGAVGSFTVEAEDSRWFLLSDVDQGDPYGLDPTSPSDMETLLEETMFYWRAWADRCTYNGRWHQRVMRSALTLKLLTFAPTGAIVAAPTTSLPEAIGGERNWDYRFTWLRDAAFTLRALFRLGYVEEGRAFLRWLADRIHEAPEDEPIQVLYGIDGRRNLKESHVEHLSGYHGSRPVRIGNAAHAQRQLDVFGEVLETVSDYADRHGDLGGMWEDLLPLMDWLVEHWREPDAGIWEVRGPDRHFVYSKVMCWVAFDRAIRLAETHELTGDVDTWKQERAAVRQQVLENGVDPKRGCFTQSYGDHTLDAANLRIPMYGFLPPDDERIGNTLKATLDELASDGLVHRYKPQETDDGLGDEEGTFSLCSFWLVDNLVLQGEMDRAWLEFEKLLTHGNHLGLFAEQLGLGGESLGNFPQAFTHIGLIHSALLLDIALTARQMTQDVTR